MRVQLSHRIRERQELGEWAAFTGAAPSGRPCERCRAVTEQRLADAPQGQVWSCRRCGGTGGAEYAFDPRRPPRGAEETGAAVRCLVQHVPALRPIDPDVLGPVVEPYFLAGWCVRDVVLALDRRPDEEPHETGSSTWTTGQPPDRTLWRVRERLKVWRWAEGDRSGTIMPGDWTTMKYAVAVTNQAQRDQQRARDDDWHQRQVAARAATGAGLAEARRAATTAAERGRRRQAHAEQAGAEYRRDRADTARRTGPAPAAERTAGT